MTDPKQNSPADDPIHDVAKARGSAYVGPGDEVTLVDSADSRGTVVGEHCGEIVALWDDDEYHGDECEMLRTPDGRPVAGFKKPLWGPYHGEHDPLLIAHDRIEELEREVIRQQKVIAVQREKLRDALVRLDDE